MKLICLNVWGGKVYNPLIAFIKKNSDTDVFCFQEVFDSKKKFISDEGFHTNLYSDLKKILPMHSGHFVPLCSGLISFNPPQFVNFPVDLGMAIFCRKTIKHKFGSMKVGEGKKPIQDPRIDIPKKLQYVEIKSGLSIFNFHGVASWPKTDTSLRLKHSEKIASAMGKFKNRKILCGDFNLAPETESLKIMGRGMTELVTKSGVTSTRSTVRKMDYLYSDYMLVSHGIKVLKFAVPKIDVSDHLPLILEFE